MELKASYENRQEHQSLRDREPPSGTLAFSSESKRLVSKAWKLFDVLWTEAIWIKPDTGELNEVRSSFQTSVENPTPNKL